MKPRIIAKLILYFEKDFDIENINELVQLLPSVSKRISSSNLNPINRMHNSGFLEIQSDEIESYDVVDAQNALLSLTHNHLDNIKHAIEKYDGEAIIVFISINEDNFPALMFDEEFLSDVNYLNSKLDIVFTTYQGI